MPNRPVIPAGIKRTVLTEARHRCAVCGATGPLEIAHIIPWHSSREHKPEDLICLCPNCHTLADNKKWGEKTLRFYKQQPHALMQAEAGAELKSTSKIELKVDIELENFDEKAQRWLQHAIAGFLEISPYSVQIVSIKDGSVNVTIRLPSQSAKKLLKAYERKDPDLTAHLAPLAVLELYQITTWYDPALKALRGNLNMIKTILQKITNAFDIYPYFYRSPWMRRIIVSILLVIIFSALISSFYSKSLMPASAIVTMVFAGLLLVFLLVDSGLYISSLLMSSEQRIIMIIRKMNSDLSFAIDRAENYVSDPNTTIEQSEIKSLAKEFLSDFGNIQPLPMLAKTLLWRTILNYWITIFCFATISMSVALRHDYYGVPQSPYEHACLDFGNFIYVLIHFLYYHAVIFQSLGDGNHAPVTAFTQIVAIGEAFTSFFYIIFIFGGLLSTATLILKEMTPEKLCAELYVRLNTLASDKNPVVRGED